jgi:hypothetical protein
VADEGDDVFVTNYYLAHQSSFSMETDRGLFFALGGTKDSSESFVFRHVRASGRRRGGFVWFS